jgi:hypothetical protein
MERVRLLIILVPDAEIEELNNKSENDCEELGRTRKGRR